VYRDWVNDTGDLINHNLLKGTARAPDLLATLTSSTAAAASISSSAAASLTALAASGPFSGLSGPSLGLSRAVRSSLGLSGPSGLSSLDPAALFADPMPLYARLGLGAGAGGAGLCGELQELFRAPVEAAAAAATEQRKAAKRGRQPSSPEVNNSTGGGGMSGSSLGRVALVWLGQHCCCLAAAVFCCVFLELLLRFLDCQSQHVLCRQQLAYPFAVEVISIFNSWSLQGCTL
jgi:hypothetical protein